MYFWSLGISLYLELFCFLSFITIVLRNLCSGTHRRNPFLGVRENSKKITQQDQEKQSSQVLTPKLTPFLLLSEIIELVISQSKMAENGKETLQNNLKT